MIMTMIFCHYFYFLFYYFTAINTCSKSRKIDQQNFLKKGEKTRKLKIQNVRNKKMEENEIN